MRITDEGIYLFSKKHGERYLILYIFSKNYGLIRCLSRISKKNNFLINLDLISFELTYKNKDTFGFIKFNHISLNKLDNSFFTLIKASAAELCMRLLPIWEENKTVYLNLYKLSQCYKLDNNSLISEYIKWEFKFLECLGYGLDITECSETGSRDVHFLSPKSGNCVCYEIGKKYEKKLFKIPNFLKNNFTTFKISEVNSCFKISSFFLKKISDKNKEYIFRNQLINTIYKLD